MECGCCKFEVITDEDAILHDVSFCDWCKNNCNDFQFMIKWFDTLKSQADRDYILQLLNEKKDVIPF